MINKRRDQRTSMLSSRLFYGAFFVSILFSAVSIISPLLSANLVNSVLASDHRWSLSLFLFITAYIVQILLASLDYLLKGFFSASEKKKMRCRSFLSISEKKYVSSEDQAGFISFLNNHIPSIVENIYKGYINLAQCAAVIVFSLIALVYMHWALATVIFSVSLIIIIVPRLMKNAARDTKKKYVYFLKKYNQQVLSFLNGINEIKQYAYLKGANKRLESENEKIENNERRLVKVSSLIEGVGGSLHLLQDVLVIIIGILLVSKQTINIGELVAALQISNIVSAPMEAIAMLLHAKNEAMPLKEEYNDLLTNYHPAQLDLSVSAQQIEFINFRLTNISYCIGDLSILSNINVEFKKGGRYLITGESGSGKSTLLGIIANFVSPSSGEIFLNDDNTDKVEPALFYQMLSLIPQSSLIFQMSLKDNILLDRQVPDKVYQHILRGVNLTDLSARYEDKEFDSASIDQLSGGEKQRICLARALIKSPQILLLDEATISLDQENESKIMKFLFNLDSTIIMVSHHPKAEWSSVWTGVYSIQDGCLIETSAVQKLK